MASSVVPTTAFTTPAFTFHSGREGSQVTIPAEATTLEGFRNWAKSDAFPNRGEISFIDGEVVVDMSPENFDVHNSLKTAVSLGIFNIVQRGNLGLFFSDRYLLSNEAADLSTEPDAMFLSRASLRAKRATMVSTERPPGTHTELLGAPDWVLEIVSPSSPRKDKELLRKSYFRAGVSEYWIIDARGEQIEFQLLVRGQRAYKEIASVSGWRNSPTFGASFRITRKRDEDGFWQYELHTKNAE